MDEDLLNLINVYDNAADTAIRAHRDAKNAADAEQRATAQRDVAAKPLMKRCGPNIPRRFLRAASGNVYEVTEKQITLVEIQGK